MQQFVDSLCHSWCGFGSTLVGVWREKITSEEVYFRADGTARMSMQLVSEHACRSSGKQQQVPIICTGVKRAHWWA